MNSKNALISGIRHAQNFTLTENIALTHKSTLSNLLDWFALGGALRERTEDDIVNIFQRAYGEDPLKALKVLFYFRDIRGGGQGERRSFRACLKWLANNHSDVLKKNMEHIPFYGRWDDLYSLIGTPVESYAFVVVKLQLVKDVIAASNGESVSLLAKWLKSENTSSTESRRLGRKTRESLGWSPRKYRKVLSNLRRIIDVTEVKMCANEWNDINFEHVPSKAGLRYRKAFSKHEASRYVEYLSNVASGKAKINAGAVYPYELLEAALNDCMEVTTKAIDLQWLNQPDWLADNPHKGLVLADVSGSMTGRPMMISVSLAIYFAERNVGPFKDHCMTFSARAYLHHIVGQTLREKYNNITQEGWCGNTDLQAAFDVILETAVNNQVPQEDMPAVLYVISDLEFDAACNSNDKTDFQMAEAKFRDAGYVMPNIVFWNVNARNDQTPVTMDVNGVCLVSGCSPSILKSVLSGKPFNPMAILEETIGKERYDRISL